jgi:hypothetical protein
MALTSPGHQVCPLDTGAQVKTGNKKPIKLGFLATINPLGWWLDRKEVFAFLDGGGREVVTIYFL